MEVNIMALLDLQGLVVPSVYGVGFNRNSTFSATICFDPRDSTLSTVLCR
jgi:hypothetical protein